VHRRAQARPGREGIVRAIEPLLGELELRLVVQLVRESG
jgi:hypothetical protein